MKRFLPFFGIIILSSCQNLFSDTLFERLKPSRTGIDFANKIEETDELNVLVYEYFYNGGGVAAADFDNDGLVDLYFTANQGSDKIYKNLGQMKFEDKTASAGIIWQKEWKTGVTVVDLNEDGLNDIYVSVSGNEEQPELRRNKLYINKGNFVFEEQAAAYGLDHNGFTTQTAFFDFDKDGDLDAYIMNHNVRDFKRFDVEAIHFMRDEFAGDRLMRNDGGHFVDVSKEAGIKGNPIGFGLGLHIADLNGDHWPDIYVSNDYLEGDYLYINKQDGTFSDEIAEMVDHTSYFSMGNDVADVNNDLLPDIFTSDMLPEDNKRQKLLFGPDNYEGYLNMLQNGFHPEVMRNMLHLNEGNGSFSEIGQLAGLSNTDWSWSPLLADFDNDGFKDLFISNGYLRDYTNNDFVKFYTEQRSEGKDNVLEIINQMPSSKVSNCIFKNNGDLSFSNKQKEWGFEDQFLTNGAIYADLDNDGDFEIITNNLNEPAAIYENKTGDEAKNHFIGVKLEGKPSENYQAKIKVFTENSTQFREFSSTHGFQSSYVGPQLFGLGAESKVNRIEIEYTNGQVKTIENPTIDKVLSVNTKDTRPFSNKNTGPFMTKLEGTAISHGQKPINDFSRQILMPWMQSYAGPCIAVADVNSDGLEDFYLGGGKGTPGQLMIADKNGAFKASNEALLKQWELCTDVDALFFDADADGDQDLYVVGGGFEYLTNDLLLQNRLYINDGKGNFTKNDEAFPADLMADACAVAFDFEGDGDQDIFVGGSAVPQAYPAYNVSRIYINEGGKFTKWESEILNQLGLVKAAETIDYNGDGLQDLVVAGEWTPVLLMKNTGKGFVFDKAALPDLSGLWSSLLIEDFDGDGDQDILAGNFGLNSQLCASVSEPLQLHVADFDQNGRLDPILTCFNQGVSYPFYSRDELLEQLVPLKKVYYTYAAYAEVNTENLLKNFAGISTEVLKAEDLKTTLWLNENGKFVLKNLPHSMQLSNICSIAFYDVNGDGKKDLITGGNHTHTRVRLGNISANHGQVFLNDGKADFTYLPAYKSGISVKGEVRAIAVLHDYLLFGVNSGAMQIYKPNKTTQ